MCLLCFSCRRTNTETMQLLSLHAVTKGDMDSAGRTCGEKQQQQQQQTKIIYKDVRMNEREEYCNAG